MNCPTCGQAVEVHNGDEGTNSYIGLELKNGLELAADKLEKLTMSEIRLATGEFGAETARVVRAVLNWQAASIRAEVAKFPNPIYKGPFKVWGSKELRAFSKRDCDF